MTTENNNINYAALANTINIDDITSDDTNRDVLRSLKNNDPDFEQFCITDERGDDGPEDDAYYPIDGEDMGWLGYYVGNSIYLREITFFQTIDTESSFYKEMSCNKSIQEIQFCGIDLLNGKVFHMLNPFLKNNHSLTRITVEESEYGVEDVRQLSLAIGSCSKSLKTFELGGTRIRDGQLVDIITSMSIHPQLTELVFMGMNIGRNECTALSTLLRCTTTQLQLLDLSGNRIDDEGVNVLVNALTNVKTLQELDLRSNRLITLNAWKRVATLLELPDTKLEKLSIANSDIGDDEAIVFATALANNTTLKTLSLSFSRITEDGWAHFSRLLCDTSSVNNTYLSNHTLTCFGSNEGQSVGVDFALGTNNMADKQRVAMIKILHAHNHFNMQPFFEWEFKVLPLMFEWFEKVAAYCTSAFEIRKINKMRLATTFDFIKEFPMLYIEPVTRKEIADYIAMEEEHLLRTGGGDIRLAEIRQHKARAMRRLQ